jgi:hypothetical protein
MIGKLFMIRVLLIILKGGFLKQNWNLIHIF